VHAAVGGAAAEVTQEEAVAEAFGQTLAWIVDEPRRAIREVHDRRHDPRWLTGMASMPHLLAIPRAAVVEPLVADAPAAVGTRHDVHEARAVATVAVVVAREQIAPLVKREFLWVAQAAVHDFEVAAVEFAAQHGAFVWIREGAVALLDVEAAIADREVEAAIRADNEAVQVVADQRRVHAVAIVQHLDVVRDAVVVGIAQFVELGDIREVDVVANRQHAGGDAVGQFVELVGKHRRTIERAVPVGVDEHADALGERAVLRDVVWDVLLVLRDAVRDRQTREIRVLPLHVAARVEDAIVDAERLGHVEAAFAVDREGDRIAEVRLGGHEIAHEARRELEALDLVLRLVAGRRDHEGRLLGAGRSVVLGNGGSAESEGGEGEVAGAAHAGSMVAALPQHCESLVTLAFAADQLRSRSWRRRRCWSRDRARWPRCRGRTTG
jgi:hypothetical protein